jgi:DNA end-binding protein Ku
MSEKPISPLRPLRYPYEVRKEEDYFDELPDQKVSKDMLDLAKHIVDTKAGHFKPDKFEDHYEQALKDLLKRKQEGKPIERPKDHHPSNVVDLMDALRKSVEAEGGGKRPAQKSADPARASSGAKEDGTIICPAEEGRLNTRCRIGTSIPSMLCREE